jgi:hypothetical protein
MIKADGFNVAIIGIDNEKKRECGDHAREMGVVTPFFMFTKFNCSRKREHMLPKSVTVTT